MASLAIAIRLLGEMLTLPITLAASTILLGVTLTRRAAGCCLLLAGPLIQNGQPSLPPMRKDYGPSMAHWPW
jgi:hypothetical protein